MARRREVATLWTGGRLSWFEQLCLKSFVDKGQKVTLFSYADVPNVPEGVIRRDGREIVEADALAADGTVVNDALFADWFRIRMLRNCSGTIWVDPDVYCHRPMGYDGDYVLGYETSEGDRVGVSVLGLPVHSPILADLAGFMSDPFAVPPYLKKSLIEAYEAAKIAGNPVHASRQPAGVWGAPMITHFADRHRLKGKMQPADAFYPVNLPERRLFLQDPGKVEAMLTGRTTALPLWAANRREIALRHGGLPPKGSYLEMLAARHGIPAEKAIIEERGGTAEDADLLDLLPEGSRIGTLADLGGTAQPLALAAHARDGCRIVLVDIDGRGAFAKTESAWVPRYLTALSAAGVPAHRVSVVRDAAELVPFDLVCNLSGFGDIHKVQRLGPFLSACFHPGSLMLMDIRKGSGSFPFLKPFGTCETVSSRDDGGVPVSRVLFRPTPPDR
ncbi:hypothetical protein [Defluviimonas sp. SAOS-178_SWC]|uniref:hypothetical protein n=1 Tax=Defluviimonas sp. SAOS-178_SWC TaxID=3121287 RepID=UPI003221773D